MSNAPAHPALHLRGVTVDFDGFRAVDGVDLEIRAAASCAS